MLNAAIDGLLEGALEIFPSVNLESLQQEKVDLLSKIRQGLGEEHENGLSIIQGYTNAKQLRPPQFIVSIDFIEKEL